MLIFNFLYVLCPGNLISFSRDSSKLHLSIVIVVFVIMSVCFLLSMLFIQRIVADYYLGALQSSLGSSIPFIFTLVANWLLSIFLKISVYQNFSEGIDVFFLYQILIALFLIASIIVLLLNSQILYEKGVKKIQYSDEVLPLSLLQWQGSLFYNHARKFIEIPLKALDRISVVLKDDTTLDYCCIAVNGDFSWSKENS